VKLRTKNSELRTENFKWKAKFDFKLYLITDGRLMPASSHFSLLTSQLLKAVRQALKGGVRAVQLREKDLGTRELLKLAYKMRELTMKYKAKLFINDRFDIALAVEADGVHLTQNSIPAGAVRKALQASRITHHASRFLIGISTHSLKEAKDAEKEGADFITLGPVYKTPSKLKYGKPLGIDILNQISRKVRIPVFAIGGIKSKKIVEVKKAGAFGAAMISEIFGAEDIEGKAREVMNLIN